MTDEKKKSNTNALTPTVNSSVSYDFNVSFIPNIFLNIFPTKTQNC